MVQLLPPAARDARLAFYANHNIGWVARPKHDGSSSDGFKRAGRFKKASNMNYGLFPFVYLSNDKSDSMASF